MEEPSRLESLWRGPFGDSYTHRNQDASQGREGFWQALLERYPVTSLLEVGCNAGANLTWVSRCSGADPIVGVDVNTLALQTLAEMRLRGVRGVAAAGRRLPFAAGSFDMVCTVGVLIHQPQESLGDVMREVLRCAGRYVLCAEYYSDSRTEVPYRGESGALFKQDFGAAYLEMSDRVSLADQGFLAKGEGSWDDVTWWLLEVHG